MACRQKRLAWRNGYQLAVDRDRDCQCGSSRRAAGISGTADRRPDRIVSRLRRKAWNPPERVLAHSDVAPIRKVDPGENFPWGRLAAAGIGHWVEPSPIGGGRFFQRGDAGQPVEALQSMLSLYGYGIEISGEYCVRTEGRVAAFQRHFRQSKVDGVADSSTIETLHRLLTSLPRFA